MKKLFLVLFCVSLPIFLMLFSYRIALFFTSLDANQEDTVNYLQNQEELSLNYTAAEVSHLEDVKSVMGITDYLFSLTAFDLAFTLFHNLFFPQGNWTFPSDSLLIRTFPLGFFMGMSYKIFLLSLGLGMGILVIGKINKEKCAD